MSQERLNNLAIISIGNEICDQLNIQEFVKEIASRRARQVAFL